MKFKKLTVVVGVAFAMIAEGASAESLVIGTESSATVNFNIVKPAKVAHSLESVFNEMNSDFFDYKPSSGNEKVIAKGAISSQSSKNFVIKMADNANAAGVADYCTVAYAVGGDKEKDKPLEVCIGGRGGDKVLEFNHVKWYQVGDGTSHNVNYDLIVGGGTDYTGLKPGSYSVEVIAAAFVN